MALIVASALALGGFGGCGGDTLDSGKLEKDLRSSLEKTTKTRVGAVNCPSDIEIKKGKRTICTTSNAAGQKVRIEVMQTDANGHVRYVVR